VLWRLYFGAVSLLPYQYLTKRHLNIFSSFLFLKPFFFFPLLFLIQDEILIRYGSTSARTTSTNEKESLMGSLNDDDFESAKELSDEDIILEIERVYFLIF